MFVIYVYEIMNLRNLYYFTRTISDARLFTSYYVNPIDAMDGLDYNLEFQKESRMRSRILYSF